MNRGAWWGTAHGVAKSQTPLSDFHFLLCIYTGFLDDSAGKDSACNAGDTGGAGSIPGLGRSPGGGNGKPPQDSCLENSMDRGV